ncbi:unnamed protein product [Bursaphelenchus xylophilus]|uniref:Large ribosomal subunit protein bL17m n=1 Tax=Bursaphelenchus xylophilus TaxID=6326 RepID=A0A1I7SSW1_BURXY|nr:unnamed protein product [Bursaphelenchus xylophilus]CAG9108860.1 unnamed protein product [Bursaphelenchus xylophilus]
MSAKIVPSLPSIKAAIGHIPQRLKTAQFEAPRGRLEILRRMITQLVREERVEFKHNRAVEARPYAERLIQLSVHRGADDEYTNKMLDWWLMEPKLKNKMFDDIVPRLRSTEEPYTYIIALPKRRVMMYKDKRIERPQILRMAVLEINGHPFPSLKQLEESRLELLKEKCL